jgi:type III secretory pathway component EscS
MQRSQILFPLGFLSVGFALVGSWVYEKSMLFAVLTSLVAIGVEYYFQVFTNLSEHYFHFSFVLVYISGVYTCYWLVNKLLEYSTSKNTKINYLM